VGCSKEEHLHRLNYWRDTACHLCSLNSCGNHDDDCLVGKYLAAHPAPPPSIRAAVEAARKAEPTDVWARECESLGRERDALRAKLVNTEDAIKADGLRFDEAIRQRDEARAKLATAERERDGLRARLELAEQAWRLIAAVVAATSPTRETCEIVCARQWLAAHPAPPPSDEATGPGSKVQP
jgi:hypothetical protein